MLKCVYNCSAADTFHLLLLLLLLLLHYQIGKVWTIHLRNFAATLMRLATCYINKHLIS